MATVYQPPKRERGDRRRIPLNMRISPVMRAELERRADANARSLTAEAELLLEQSLRVGEGLGGPWQRAMDVLAAFAQAERVARLTNPGWAAPLDDPAIYAGAMMHAIESLGASAPAGADVAIVLSAALNEYVQSHGGRQ